jgi:hypothetical protein
MAVSVADFDEPLNIAAHPHGPAARVTDDNPLIQFAPEPSLDRELIAAGEAQGRLVGDLIASRHQVGNAVPILTNELGRANTA